MRISATVKLEFEGDRSMDEMALETALQRALTHLCVTIERSLRTRHRALSAYR